MSSTARCTNFENSGNVNVFGVRGMWLGKGGMPGEFEVGKSGERGREGEGKRGERGEGSKLSCFFDIWLFFIIASSQLFL